MILNPRKRNNKMVSNLKNTDLKKIDLKNRKICFYLIVMISFFLIFAMNCFTPMLSDDFDYAGQARSAGSLLDLFRQEYHQYMTWNGRSVTFMCFRIFLNAPEIILKLANSIVFTTLSVLIYLNIDGKKEYDPFVMLLSQLGLWIFTVSFSQTILWECGAFVYLWGMTIILGFVTLVRQLLIEFDKNESIDKKVLWVILVFIFGWLAGWCNENTSGGSILFILIYIIYRKVKKIKIPTFLYSALSGNLIGLGFLVLGPGVRTRAALAADDNYTGIMAIVARVQKLTLYEKDAFLVLLMIMAATMIWTVVISVADGKEKGLIDYVVVMRKRLLYLFLHFATVYALALTSLPEIRAVFGPGIFLLIACIQGITDNMQTDSPLTDGEHKAAGIMLHFVYVSVAIAMTIYLLFDIVEGAVNLQRIRRDYDERIAYIEEQIASGNQDIVVARFHTDFACRYTCAYEMELSDDPTYWTNVQYTKYFGVNSIIAIPYDEWESTYGQ